MASEIGLLLQAGIAATFCNFKSDSRDGVSTTKRTEGWTEVWGSSSKQHTDKDDEDKAEEEDCWKFEEETSKQMMMMMETRESVIINPSPQDVDDDASLPTTPSLTIVQYRPAWLEQLVLRIVNVPHIVLNSSFSSTESTGRLPYLRDTKPTITTTTPPTTTPIKESQQFPILVGRRQPRLRAKLDGIPGVDNDDVGSENDDHDEGGKNRSDSDSVVTRRRDQTTNNDILGYLKAEMGIDLDALVAEELESGDSASASATAAIQSFQSKSTVWIHLITTKLQPSLMILRYEDSDAWEQIYRKQCIECSRTNKQETDSSSSSLPTFRGLFQAWSERVLERKSIWTKYSSTNTDTPSIDEAKQVAKDCYELLEQQLKQNDENDNNNDGDNTTTTSSRFLLNTKRPALVDAILWDHLADALCDVHLVVVLADFPLLVQYFQRIHKLYFDTTTPTKEEEGEQKEEEWKVWNQYQNQRNAFQQIPVLLLKEQQHHYERDNDNNNGVLPKQRFQHAIELMQALSIRDDNLLEVLRIGKATRQQQRQRNWKKKNNKKGSSTHNTKKDDTENNNKQQLSAIEIARREHERSDQYWVSIVIGAAILVAATVLKTDGGEE